MNDRVPAEVFPPGEFVREEIEARGWSQTDLAEILGRPVRVVNEIVAGKRSISPETATGLGEAFGTGAQFWMNLETAFQLARVKGRDDTVARRASLYGAFPLKDLVRRHWIEPSDNVEVLEKRLLGFFRIRRVDETPPQQAHAARKSSRSDNVTSAQNAWLLRVQQLAHAVTVGQFSSARLTEGLATLRRLLHSAEEIRHIPRVLAEAGVRFLIVEPLPRTRIDGACLWLDRTSPVVALSLRYDRIDYFWHTLIHELGHVKHGDGRTNAPAPTLDVDLVGDNATPFRERSEVEQRADQFATSFLVEPTELDGFIARVRPLYSKAKINGFAARIQVHPGIVVGQLQFREEISYAHSREMLAKVRAHVTDATLTDGWGHVPPPGV